ncbi:hypothetical protein CGMCC3_g17879 [Colletotrichum fructicola]|uniref:Uncharacterized protein n=1 Tax=Colletotrichum fructicola (strain Nara gc5) TaxID=1213859 RepID=A0A7J6IDV3_COLFN|nr:uncharacterized protein CGMCC3_g17879 [Colletotrichum fructicola]KAE9565948.1 hypothetical protein CGMCC3_g17879 [Colletotrichum fructicola]KAF4418872.1 hypothetical protein CFRS1_v015287 [Colletotrichum fructicola]KAF4474432.1 hypothetical protein CGGC5_v017115 [Colletotrichum fructicola Nara gc5]KAF4881005.1 hypothetical protein CGCFRS4_v015989 [Colletotrichum fructicola]
MFPSAACCVRIVPTTDYGTITTNTVVCFLLGNGFRKDSLLDRCIWRCLLFLDGQTDEPEQEADENNPSFGCEHIAAATGLLMVMVHLLASGHSINCTDRNGRTPADYAEKYGIASNNIVQCLSWLAWVSK